MSDDSIPLKRCTKCGQMSPATLEYFPSHKTHSDGLYSHCKVCVNTAQKEQRMRVYGEQVLNAPVPEGHKRCAKCKQIFLATIEYFHVTRRNKDHLSNRCKACGNAGQRERRINPPPPSLPDGYKRCITCKQLYPKTAEYFYTHGPKYLHSECKECMKATQRKRPIDILPEGYKRCGTCKEIKPATREYFYPKKGKTISLASSCKICRRAYLNRVLTPEKKLAHSRKYEALPKYKEKRRQQAEARKRPVEVLPDGFKRCSRCKQVLPATTEYFTRSSNKRAKYNLRAACRECERKALRESPVHNRAKRIYNKNRRAHRNQIEGVYTEQQIQEQYDRQKGKCYYCHKKVKWGKHTIDHTFPISRVAGMGIPANDINYLVIACQPCNSKKGNKFPWEWPEGGRLL